MRHGIKLSPRDRRLAFWGWAVRVYLFLAGREEEALKRLASLQGEIRVCTCP